MHLMVRSSTWAASSSVGDLRWVLDRWSVLCQGAMISESRTMSQPVGVCQVVSSTRVPGRYRRAAGTATPNGPTRNEPPARSSSAVKMLGESGRGTHIHSTAPDGAIRQFDSQSERNAYSPMLGKLPELWCASCGGGE